MSKYLKFKELAVKSYNFYPHFELLNYIVWEFFEREDRPMWFSDIKDIAVKTNIELLSVRCFITCLRGSSRSKDPKLLTEMFWYKAQEGKELILLQGKGLREHAKQVGIQDVSDEIIHNLALNIFVCWHPEPNNLSNKLLVDRRFIKSENCLSGVWHRWLG
jgi:hypothetical protein